MNQPRETLGAAAFQLYQAARDAGEYEVAYHALCAALHAAEGREDEAACRLLEHEAKNCAAWIDANAPRHRLSTISAQQRGHESIFRQLAVMCDAARLRIHADAQKRKRRPQAPSSGDS